MSFNNTRDISCFGLRRSGNHAILNWIIMQNNGSFVHLNDVKLYTNRDPYKSFSKATIGGINPLVYHQGSVKFRRFLKFLVNSKIEYLYGGDSVELDREKLRKYKLKSLLIHSYEHYSLSKIFSSTFEEKRVEFLGKSQYTFDILILRDPYNTFASLIKRGENSKNFDLIIKKWIEHAKEYLGLSNYLQNRISISYNHWFENKAYRQKIAEALGLVFTDDGINIVSNVGQGSSFDRTNYQGKANQMNVLYRYKDFLDHPVMLRLFADRELNELSEEIFGLIQ